VLESVGGRVPTVQLLGIF